MIFICHVCYDSKVKEYREKHGNIPLGISDFKVIFSHLVVDSRIKPTKEKKRERKKRKKKMPKVTLDSFGLKA